MRRPAGGRAMLSPVRGSERPPPVAGDRRVDRRRRARGGAIATLLGGSLTTEGSPTNNPESERADDAAGRLSARRHDGDQRHRPILPSTRSTRTVQGVRAGLRRRRPHHGARGRRTYLDTAAAGLVSEDRMRRSSRLPCPTTTRRMRSSTRSRRSTTARSRCRHGQETLDHDFNLLSQEDLENGELKFGLPAALIILLLVFGASSPGWCRC